MLHHDCVALHSLRITSVQVCHLPGHITTASIYHSNKPSSPQPTATTAVTFAAELSSDSQNRSKTLLHTVTVTTQWNFKAISPHDGMMTKCFQHDNFCHTLISVCVCEFTTEMYNPGDGCKSLMMCNLIVPLCHVEFRTRVLDPISIKRGVMVMIKLFQSIQSYLQSTFKINQSWQNCCTRSKKVASCI